MSIRDPSVPRDDLDVTMLLEPCRNLGQSPRFERIVGVQEAVDISGRQREALVEPIGGAGVLLQNHVREMRAVSLDDVATTICRASIDDNVLDLNSVLSNDGPDRCLEEFALIEGDRNNRKLQVAPPALDRWNDVFDCSLRIAQSTMQSSAGTKNPCCAPNGEKSTSQINEMVTNVTSGRDQ